jgi:hypothetical protein
MGPSGLGYPAHRVCPDPRKYPEPGGLGWESYGLPGESDGPPKPDPAPGRVRAGSGFAGGPLKSN